MGFTGDLTADAQLDLQMLDWMSEILRAEPASIYLSILLSCLCMHVCMYLSICLSVYLAAYLPRWIYIYIYYNHIQHTYIHT